MQGFTLSMNPWTKKWIELAINNYQLALDKDDPQITWAVLVNTLSTIDGYIEQAYYEKKERETE
jgi:hypothetical protein